MAADNATTNVAVELREVIAHRPVGTWEQVTNSVRYGTAAPTANQRGLRLQPSSFAFEGEHDGTRL